MHKTLKAEAIRPPKGNLAAQQRAFTAFRTEFNSERPHSALGGDPPGSHYVTSARPFPDRLPPLEYPGHFIVKRVTNAGTFRLKHKLLFIANALKQNYIGLEEINEASGLSISGQFCLAESTNEKCEFTASESRNECYPSSRFTLSPIIPVPQVLSDASPSDIYGRAFAAAHGA
jgi:hypothetical protein